MPPTEHCPRPDSRVKRVTTQNAISRYARINMEEEDDGGRMSALQEGGKVKGHSTHQQGDRRFVTGITS